MYRALRPIAGYAMASLRQRSAALVAGGFWWILLADRRRSRRASRSESFFKIVAGTLALPGFLCARAIPFIANEWTCRGGGGVRPHPSPTRALQRANLSYRTTGSHKAIRKEKNHGLSSLEGAWQLSRISLAVCVYFRRLLWP